MIKRDSPAAYKDWTPEEDAQLRSELEAGVPISEIARAHARQPNAVRSRIRKLGS
jgi:hypothetical protein